VEAPEHVQTASHTQEDFSGREIGRSQVDVTFDPEEPEEPDWNGEVHLPYFPGQIVEI
jgi:hypothetical protein